MKKIILTVAAVFAMSFANAQDLKSKKGENYLPEAGDWAIGFNADGLFNYAGNAFNHTANVAPSVDFQKENAGTFVGKKFTSATEAYRVVANFKVNSGTVTDADGNKATNSGFALTAGLGKEWRKGKTRLQGFYGVDALVGISSSSSKSATGVETKDGLGFNIGANGFIGAEYFLFPKISIGAQYGYGLKLSSQAATTVDGVKTGNATTGFNLGGVSVSSINMTLHF
jgi:hypothetical protein